MLKERRSVRNIAKAIGDAADYAFESYVNGEAAEEPQITDRLIGAIGERLRNKRFRGINWSARTLRTSRGVGAEEKRHGADLSALLNLKQCCADVRAFEIRILASSIEKQFVLDVFTQI